MHAVVFALLWMWVSSAQDEEIVLPRQMGAINDYAAVLGSARAELEAHIQTIKESFNVQIVILASIYDPFDNAALYAQKIWEFWKLGNDTVLLVFVKEQTLNRWAFAVRLGPAVQGRLREEDLARMQKGLTYHLERKHIKTAMEESVRALQAMLEGSYGQPPPRRSGGRLSWWIWMGVGLLGLGGLALGIRALVRNYCPRCGARLRSYHTYSRQGVRVAYRSCPRCGYSRLR